MKLTPGKLSGLKAISNDRSVIAAAAMDQRRSLHKSLTKEKGSEVNDHMMEEFKSLVTEVLTPHAAAILLDPEWGLPASRRRRKFNLESQTEVVRKEPTSGSGVERSGRQGSGRGQPVKRRPRSSGVGESIVGGQRGQSQHDKKCPLGTSHKSRSVISGLEGPDGERVQQVRKRRRQRGPQGEMKRNRWWLKLGRHDFFVRSGALALGAMDVLELLWRKGSHLVRVMLQ